MPGHLTTPSYLITLDLDMPTWSRRSDPLDPAISVAVVPNQPDSHWDWYQQEAKSGQCWKTLAGLVKPT
jgi:hypothetical protein